VQTVRKINLKLLRVEAISKEVIQFECIRYCIPIRKGTPTGEMQNSGKKGTGKAVPLQAWSGTEGSRKLRFPDFVTTQDGCRLSALRTGRLYPRKCSWYSFLLEAESTPGL